MKSKHSQKRKISADDVFDAIDVSLESDWESESDDSLPEGLRDPFRVRERGEQLLKQGLFFTSALTKPEICEEEFRMAARNGKGITDEMLERMHEERKQVEAQRLLTFDES